MRVANGLPVFIIVDNAFFNEITIKVNSSNAKLAGISHWFMLEKLINH